MAFAKIETLDNEGCALAFDRRTGAPPTFVWLGGFKSDMGGTKAEALAAWARQRGQAFVRFDYSGHGQSGGAFEDGTITRWLSDALAVVDHVTEGPVVLIGSSMGGWLALLTAQARRHRVKGLILIAPAADMTERLMWASFPDEVRDTLTTAGRWERPSAYDPEPYVITRRLIEDGRNHLIMDSPIPFPGPVHILQGGQDPDVPAAHVQALAKLIQAPELEFELIADGDHRLSRPQDLNRLLAAASGMADRLSR